MKIDRNLSDLIKVYSCINIAIGHYLGCLVTAGVTYSLPMRICMNLSALCVEFFFLLSGYGLMESMKKSDLTIKEYITRRISKVYIPTVLSAVIWGGYLLISGHLENVTVYSFLSRVAWGWFDGILWFIQILIVLYFLFFLYKEIDKKLNSMHSFIALFIICLIGVTFGMIYFEDYMAIAVPAFFIGIAVSRFSEITSQLLRNHIILLLSVLPTVFLIWAFKNNNLILRNIFFYYVIFILLALCAHNFGLKFKVPDFIIKTSFDVYLIHYKVLIILGGLFEIIPFRQFIFFTIVATFLFYNFRNYIFKINRIKLLLINRNQQ